MTETQNTEKQRPVESFRDGAIQVAVWPRKGSNGIFYEIDRSRSYKDKDGEWQKTTLISDRDMLKARYLEEQAYAAIQRLKDQDRALQAYQRDGEQDAPELGLDEKGTQRQSDHGANGLAMQRDAAMDATAAPEPERTAPEPSPER